MYAYLFSVSGFLVLATWFSFLVFGFCFSILDSGVWCLVSGFRVSGFPGFWVSGFLGFRVSGFPGFWVSGFLGFWVSGFLGFWVSGFLGFWVSGFLGFWVFRLLFLVLCFLILLSSFCFSILDGALFPVPCFWLLFSVSALRNLYN